MATLPAYVNRADFDGGSNSFRLTDTGEAKIGEGVASLGSGIFSAGLAGYKQQERDALKLEAREERNANYHDEIEMIRLGDRVQQYAEELKNKVGEDASGYTKQVDQFANDEYNKLITSGRLKRVDQAHNDLVFERTRNQIVDKAAGWETTTGNKFRADITERRMGEVLTSVQVKGKEGLGEATTAWSEFVSRTPGLDTRNGKAILEFGNRRIARAALEAEAAKRPEEFVAKFQGAFTETPSATSGNPLVDASLKYAPGAGVSPQDAVAIGWIESRLNPAHDGPRLAPGAPRALGRKGATHMSSAEGGWQILDGVARDFGLTIEEKKDPDKATAAVMRHFSLNQDKIKRMGQEVTPGKLYMFWNVGEDVAKNILRADPNTPIERIIYGSYPSDPSMAAQVLRNNPSLYKAGMTAGEVRANYERKMETAKEATRGYFTGERIQTDEQSRLMVNNFLGSDLPVGTKDVAEVFSAVSKQVQENTKARAEIDRGNFLRASPANADHYDQADKKAINRSIEAQYGTSLLQGVASGDKRMHGEAVALTYQAGFIPDKVMHGLRTALDSGSEEAATVALSTLREIRRGGDGFIRRSTMESRDREALDQFIASTEVLGLSEGEAAKRVIFDRSEEGQTKRKAMAETFKNEWRNGAGSEFDANTNAWKEITSKFDNSFFSTPEAVTGVQQAAIVEAYQRGIQYNRLRGDDLETAKANTIAQLKGVWGTSSIADPSKSQTVMAFPPELVLGEARRINGSFDWVRKQAENHVRTELVFQGKLPGFLESTDFGDGISRSKETPVPKFALVPAQGSAADARDGRPVGYDIFYEDKNGMKQKLAAAPFYPNFADAKRQADADFSRRRPEQLRIRDQNASDMADFALQGGSSEWTPLRY